MGSLSKTPWAKRIMIFGRPGSGKSTFAFALHQKTGIPVCHLDKYFFTNAWMERDYGEFIKIQQAFADQESWIMDGNSTKSLEIRYQKADVVLYFNYSKWICLMRLVKRYLLKKREIDDRAPGCDERIRYALVVYMWHFEKRVEEQIQRLRKKYPDTVFIEINNDTDLAKVRRFLIPV